MKQDYHPNDFEKKWQKVWEKKRVYQPDLKESSKRFGKAQRKPFYNLMMFPYPSAEGLHVGNMYAFTGADIYGRYKRMQGNDVFEPIGLDGFGIHSENYAIKVGKHPLVQAKISAKNFYRQLHAIGNGFAWENTLETYDPDYYKWTQWIFVQLFKKGLAYRKKSEVNFCPSCKTVLSDEQVIEGRCERCKTIVEKREMEQWFFKITAYAEKLLQNTYAESFKWSEKVKIGQRNWIGKKEGINITYKIKDSADTVTVFTTAPVNFGATFIVVAPEHQLIQKIAKKDKKINEYVNKSLKKKDIDRIAEGKEKTGVFTGLYAINHVNNKEIPIWVTDFVLTNVGTGAVQGCPGHDKRDFEFAKKFDLPIVRVVVGEDGYLGPIKQMDQVVEHGKKGNFVNSDFLNGLDFETGLQKTMDYFEEKGWGKRVTTYKLRDWCISRQRYWGAPIPMIHCDKCNWNPVPEDELPVLLPPLSDWKPEGTGKGPLAKIKSFVETKCPNCGGKADRETDVCDTFLDSSWYHLRYSSVDDKINPWHPEITKKWLPVNQYIGGAEHTVLHLLYARFIAMVFKDMGYLEFDEPYTRFYAHGLIIAEGAKMSKSRGNVIVPDIYISKYGADTLRAYLMFLGPFDQGGDFRDTGIQGMYRFLNRVWRLVNNENIHNSKFMIHDSGLFRFMHKTIKEVTEDIGNLRYNTAIAHIMEYVHEIQSEKIENNVIDKKIIETLLLLFAPFAPHMTEELWQNNQKTDKYSSIHLQKWPSYDPEYLVSDEITIVVQVNGKVRETLIVSLANAKQKDQIELTAKKSVKVKPYLDGKNIIKAVFVPGKLINFVV